MDSPKSCSNPYLIVLSALGDKEEKALLAVRDKQEEELNEAKLKIADLKDELTETSLVQTGRLSADCRLIVRLALCRPADCRLTVFGWSEGSALGQ